MTPRDIGHVSGPHTGRANANPPPQEDAMHTMTMLLLTGRLSAFASPANGHARDLPHCGPRRGCDVRR